MLLASPRALCLVTATRRERSCIGAWENFFHRGFLRGRFAWLSFGLLRDEMPRLGGEQTRSAAELPRVRKAVLLTSSMELSLVVRSFCWRSNSGRYYSCDQTKGLIGRFSHKDETPPSNTCIALLEWICQLLFPGRDPAHLGEFFAAV